MKLKEWLSRNSTFFVLAVGLLLMAGVTFLIGVILPQGMLEFREAFMFVIVILILLFRPEGLIRGANSSRRVG